MTVIDVSLIHCRCLVISHLVNCSRSFGSLNAAYGDKCGAPHCTYYRPTIAYSVYAFGP